jgi:magnesium-dependent phosphatase 1
MDYPELVVFDADACLWDQEMYEMPQIPKETDVVYGDLNGLGRGVVATKSGPHEIRLHAGSLLALQQHALGKHYPGMKICIASSADTPLAERICRANLKLLQVLPAGYNGDNNNNNNQGGLTVWDLFMRDWNGTDVNQIGRQAKNNLSSDKSRSHFPNLRRITNIRYDKMLFFDDCNWGDHCGMVATNCRETDTNQGPAIWRTPNGLGVKEWHDGLATYRKHAAAASATDTTTSA